MASQGHRTRLLPYGLTDKQIEALNRGDVDGLLKEFGNDSRSLLFVINNMAALKRRGVYEKALARAWINVEGNHHHVPLRTIGAAFEAADRQKLLAAGDSLPPGRGVFTVYRGVAGKGHARRIRGLSWTTSLPTACWFALRLHLADPAIFASWVNWYEILWHKSGTEDEFLFRPQRVWRLLIPLKEMQALSRTYHTMCKDE